MDVEKLRVDALQAYENWDSQGDKLKAGQVLVLLDLVTVLNELVVSNVLICERLTTILEEKMGNKKFPLKKVKDD